MDFNAFEVGFTAGPEKVAALYTPGVHKTLASRKRLMKVFAGEAKNLSRKAKEAGSKLHDMTAFQMLKKMINPKTSAIDRADFAAALKQGPITSTATNARFIPKDVKPYGKKFKKVIGIDFTTDKELNKVFALHHESLESLSKPLHYPTGERVTWMTGPKRLVRLKDFMPGKLGKKLYSKLEKSLPRETVKNMRAGAKAAIMKRHPITGNHSSPEVLIRESNLVSRMPPKQRGIMKALRQRSGEQYALKQVGIRYSDEYIPVNGRRMNKAMDRLKHNIGVV